jgi:homoserine kinase type II
MIPIAQIEEGVERRYGLKAASLHSLHLFAFDWRGIYRIADSEGRSWVLRAIRHADAREWLARPAAALLWLERQEYPAPRVLPARDGDPVAEWSGWSLLITSFLPGDPVRPLPEPLRLTADALGRLHGVRLPPTESGSRLATSRLHFSRALPVDLPLPETVASRLPLWLSSIYRDLYATMLRVRDRADLPLSLVHGDCWYTNAILTTPDRVAFIDWDNAGAGAAVLDLGYLLLSSHYDLDRPATVSPNASLIGAILEGYSRHRRLSAAEREALPIAIRFPLAMHGAAQLLEGEPAEGDLVIRKLRARFAATEGIARLAEEWFCRGGV